jgi:carbamoyltransferase
MTKSIEKHYLGLAKVMFGSSVTHVTGKNPYDPEMVLTERITRNKASGAWPEHALQYLKPKIDLDHIMMAENRDVTTPKSFEDQINTSIPFYSYIEKKGLEDFSSNFNQSIEYISHHFCHAYAALAMSPFNNSLIVVIDGAGSNSNDFQPTIDGTPGKDMHEECSVYLQDGHTLKCVQKNWQKFKPSKIPGHDFSNGIGMFYEKIAEYIFNNKRSAGKVMGLASFDISNLDINNISKYLENLDWARAFHSQDKNEWENSINLDHYKSVAAIVQNTFEKKVVSLLTELKNAYPEIDNIILTGGTALNCTNNIKVFNSKLFSNVYIPPFPSDECISYGLAYGLLIRDQPQIWKPTPIREQHGYFGPKSSIVSESEIEEVFEEYEVKKSPNIYSDAAKLLDNNKVVAWFQGRSESGPRALGNRSILASPKFPELKDYLNKFIKFREDFRPYGCSVPEQFADLYFQVPKLFPNPYMSFATKVVPKYREALKEVSHIDDTSRMQTVSPIQNEEFYKLLMEFGNQSGLYCLLNTSLNIMGEPIVESISDLLYFLENSEIDYVVVKDFIIKNNKD